MVAVAGHDMQLYCTGEGRGADGRDGRRSRGRRARLADRAAGGGAVRAGVQLRPLRRWLERVGPKPRTSPQIVEELHALPSGISRRLGPSRQTAPEAES
jgi:hypothetical protein